MQHRLDTPGYIMNGFFIIIYIYKDVHVALQLANGFNFHICVCNGEKEREKRNQGRFVSTLINAFPVRFVSSYSALDRVFTAHSSNKAFSSFLVGRHRFILCVLCGTMSPGTWGQPLDCNPLSRSVFCRRKTQRGIKRRDLRKKGWKEMLKQCEDV